MRHEVTIEGPNFALRPVRREDAAFIVSARSGNPFLNTGADSVAAQREWLDAYFERPGDYYFVVQDRANARPEGLIALYGIDAETSRAEWGRWVLRPGSVAAVESALLIYEFAFERLGLDALYCRTLLDNRQVVSFHDRTGLVRGPEVVAINIDGTAAPAVEHRLERSDWPQVKARLGRIAARLREHRREARAT